MACSGTVGGVPTSKDSCRARYLTCARKDGFDCSISRHCTSRPNRHNVRTLEHVQPILVFQVLISSRFQKTTAVSDKAQTLKQVIARNFELFSAAATIPNTINIDAAAMKYRG